MIRGSKNPLFSDHACSIPDQLQYTIQIELKQSSLERASKAQSRSTILTFYQDSVVSNRFMNAV